MQRGKVVANLVISAIPLVWTILLVLWKRNRFSLTVSMLNLVPSIGWLIIAFPLVLKAFYP